MMQYIALGLSLVALSIAVVSGLIANARLNAMLRALDKPVIDPEVE